MGRGEDGRNGGGNSQSIRCELQDLLERFKSSSESFLPEKKKKKFSENILLEYIVYF